MRPTRHVGPTILRVGERSSRDPKYAKDEYLLAAPGSIVAPRRRNEEPSLLNAARALFDTAVGAESPSPAQAGAAVTGGGPRGLTAYRGTAKPLEVGAGVGGPKVAGGPMAAPVGGALRSTAPLAAPGGLLTYQAQAAATAPRVSPGASAPAARQDIVTRLQFLTQNLQGNPQSAALLTRLTGILNQLSGAWAEGGAPAAGPPAYRRFAAGGSPR